MIKKILTILCIAIGIFAIAWFVQKILKKEDKKERFFAPFDFWDEDL